MIAEEGIADEEGSNHQKIGNTRREGKTLDDYIYNTQKEETTNERAYQQKNLDKNISLS